MKELKTSKMDRRDSNLAGHVPSGKKEREVQSKGAGLGKITSLHSVIRFKLLDETDEEYGDVEKAWSGGQKELFAQGLNRRNILHELIDAYHDFDIITITPLPDHIQIFVERLIIHCPDLLSQRTTDASKETPTPLEQAAKKNKPTFFTFIGLLLPENRIKALKENYDPNMSSEEMVLKLKLSSTELRIIEAFMKSDTKGNGNITVDSGGGYAPSYRPKEPQLLDATQGANVAATRGKGRTDSSRTLDVKSLEEWNEKLRQALISALSMEHGSSCLHTLLSDESTFASSRGSSMKPEQDWNFDLLISLCPADVFNNPDSKKGYIPLHYAISLYGQKQIDFGKLNRVIFKLVEKAPQTIYSTCKMPPAGNQLTPYRLLKEICNIADRNTGQEGHDVADEDVSQEVGKETAKGRHHKELEKFLKRTVIGAPRPRSQKIEYLYGGPKNASKIFFDLPFLGKNIDIAYINELDERVKPKFDTTLEYVSLPERRLQEHNAASSTAQERTRTVQQKTLPQLEQDPYVEIFDWIKEEKGVEKIFMVMVDDLGPDPHSDDGIRKALSTYNGTGTPRTSRFDIEVWDWRKLDVCSETIAAAAPNVRDLYLYSSGNPAVLRGWACKYGLPELKKLQSITIKAFPRKSDDQAYAEAIEKFKERFGKRRPEVKIHDESPKASSAIHQWEKDARSANDEKNVEVPWLKGLKTFITAMDDKFEATRERFGDDKCKSVKIALIDDGVNIHEDQLPTIQDGISFHADTDQSRPFRDYFTGPSKHGTQMAVCIGKVCPMAELYVARMDDSKPGAERFTLHSAIESLKWAIEMGVDVISMSWSFMWKTHPNSDTIQQFKEVIEQAKSHGILLFGSMNDAEGSVHIDDYYPASLPHVILIGAGDAYGNKPKFGGGRKSDYRFPGEEVNLTDPEGENVHVDGSSLATAFAAGLAGLIISSLRMHQFLQDPNAMKKDISSRLDRIKTKEGMAKVFDLLGGKSGQDIQQTRQDLYVSLGSFFSKEMELEWERDLGDVLDEICGKI